MSGGGAQQVSSTNPWAAAAPYLTDIMGKASSLYGSTAPNYANPSSNFGYPQVTGAVGNSINGTTPLGTTASSLSPGVTSAVQQQLTGQPDYTAVNGAIDAANTQQWNQFYNQVVPQLNQRASFLGNPSGAIKDLNSSITNLTQNQNLNAQQAYLGQYNQAQQNQLTAAGLGGNLMANAGQQSLTGASLFPAISQQPQQNLADYASIIANSGGKYGSGSLSINPGSGAAASNIIGGLTAGTGLVNGLLSPGSPIGSYLGSLLGPSAGPDMTGVSAGTNAALAPLGAPVTDLTGGGNLNPGANGASTDPSTSSGQTYQQPTQYDAYSAAAPGVGGAGLGAVTGALTGGAPAASVGIYDAAGNLLAGGAPSAASGGTAAAASGAAPSGASGAAGGGLGIAGGAAAGFLAAQLAQGLLSGTGHPINSVANSDAQAWTNSWLNDSGPGLKFVAGDGGPNSTYYLKNGTQMSGDQYQQLQAMTQNFIQGNNANNGALGSNKGLTPAQNQQLTAYVNSVATHSDPSTAGYGSPTQATADQGMTTGIGAGMTPDQFAAMQQFYSQYRI